LKFPDDEQVLMTGRVLFTTSGRELLRVCDSQSEEGFLEYTIEKWKSFNIDVTAIN
jgi:hypothetical protein